MKFPAILEGLYAPSQKGLLGMFVVDEFHLDKNEGSHVIINQGTARVKKYSCLLEERICHLSPWAARRWPQDLPLFPNMSNCRSGLSGTSTESSRDIPVPEWNKHKVLKRFTGAWVHKVLKRFTGEIWISSYQRYYSYHMKQGFEYGALDWSDMKRRIKCFDINVSSSQLKNELLRVFVWVLVFALRKGVWDWWKDMSTFWVRFPFILFAVKFPPDQKRGPAY